MGGAAAQPLFPQEGAEFCLVGVEDHWLLWLRGCPHQSGEPGSEDIKEDLYLQDPGPQ